MDINPTIFREYDIRGRVGEPGELTPEVVEEIHRGFAVFLKRRGITEAVVGYDARPDSKAVKDTTVEALLASGINVTEIGTVIAPVFYFAQYHLEKKGGVMVTASHNPWGWSGFKHAYDYSTTFIPADMAELKRIVDTGEFEGGAGRHETFEGILTAYQAYVLGRIQLAGQFRVLIDAGNGTAGPIVPAILRAAGCEVIEQYTDVSADRHHEANPSNIGMIEAMRRGVRDHHADIGFGFDDDGDRLGIVDERGGTVWPDRILALLARPLLTAEPGAKIVFDVKCTEGLLEDIRAHGGTPIMWKTGHSYIKAKSKEVDAALAGERSGHFFFRRGYYGYDDAVFAALKLLEYLASDGRPLSAVVADLPQYITSPVWSAPCDDTKKYAVVDALVAELKQEFGPEKVIDINGARVYFEDGWGLVRASSNVPALVLVFEAKTEGGVRRIESFFRQKLARFPEVGSKWESG